MDARDVRKGFLDAVRRVDKPKYVQEEPVEDTPEVIAQARNRKYFTYVAGEGDRYIRRRPI